MLNQHAAAACSPTRAMLMSGTDAHLGGLGVLIEYKQNKARAKRYSGKAGYEGWLTEDVATLPAILEDNGYFTVMSGKVSPPPSSCRCDGYAPRNSLRPVPWREVLTGKYSGT